MFRSEADVIFTPYLYSFPVETTVLRRVPEQPEDPLTQFINSTGNQLADCLMTRPSSEVPALPTPLTDRAESRQGPQLCVSGDQRALESAVFPAAGSSGSPGGCLSSHQRCSEEKMPQVVQSSAYGGKVKGPPFVSRPLQGLETSRVPVGMPSRHAGAARHTEVLPLRTPSRRSGAGAVGARPRPDSPAPRGLAPARSALTHQPPALQPFLFGAGAKKLLEVTARVT